MIICRFGVRITTWKRLINIKSIFHSPLESQWWNAWSTACRFVHGKLTAETSISRQGLIKNYFFRSEALSSRYALSSYLIVPLEQWKVEQNLDWGKWLQPILNWLRVTICFPVYAIQYFSNYFIQSVFFVSSMFSVFTLIPYNLYSSLSHIFYFRLFHIVSFFCLLHSQFFCLLQSVFPFNPKSVYSFTPWSVILSLHAVSFSVYIQC